MSNHPIPTRVRYYDRQFLQAADLTADQTYHRQMRWRHNLSLHSWGILAGLEVDTTFEDTLIVTAGMALDGYGRELVLAQSIEVRQQLNRDQAYDVWLVYHEVEVTQANFRQAGQNGSDANRYQEKPRVAITRTAERQSPDPAKPNEVPAGDLDFNAERTPPSDGRPWPVFLGRLDQRDDGGKRVWQVDSRERRYAGLIAERIVARHEGSARTAIFSGKESTLPNAVFAIGTINPSAQIDPAIVVRTTKLGGANEQPQTTKKVIEFHADRLTASGDITLMDGAAVEFRPNNVRKSQGETPGAGPTSEHWRIYHHFEVPDEDAANGQTNTPQETSFKDELRITMPNNPIGGNSIAIGCFDDKGKFTPILAVKNDNTVEVYGTLKVLGEFQGTRAKVPAGAEGSGQRLTSQQRYTKFREELPQIPLSELVGFVSQEPNFAEFAAKEQPVAITKELWKTPAVIAQNATPANIRDFLALPQVAAQVAPWVMDNSVPARATELAKVFPVVAHDLSLKAFVTELSLPGNKSRLQALLTSLSEFEPNASAEPLAEAFLNWPHVTSTPTAAAVARMTETMRLLAIDLSPTPLQNLDLVLNGNPISFDETGTAQGTIRKDARLRAILRFAHRNLPPDLDNPTTNLQLQAKYFLQAVQVLATNIGDKL